jgi:hypothetical protein
MCGGWFHLLSQGILSLGSNPVIAFAIPKAFDNKTYNLKRCLSRNNTRQNSMTNT